MKPSPAFLPAVPVLVALLAGAFPVLPPAAAQAAAPDPTPEPAQDGAPDASPDSSPDAASDPTPHRAPQRAPRRAPARASEPPAERSPAALPDERSEAARNLARLLARRQQPYPPIESAAVAPTGRDAEIEAAVRHYRETGDASVIKRSDEVLFPFDASQPVVHCSPLRACDVELQAGEVVTGVAVGDSERWMAAPLMSGDPDNPTPHVILKPRAYDAVTNIVIATSRRTYHLGLVSPAKDEVTAGRLAYHRRVGFYYPDELVEQWADAERLAAHRTASRETARAETLSPTGALDLDALNFAYSTRADKRATWTPSVVFDDGHHVYLRLPAAALAGELPALLVEADDGRLGVANYRVNDRWYVVDTLFRRAVLVRGVGKKKLQVEIRSLRRDAAS